MDIDVYDSTTSNHMSPSKHCFVTLKETPPHPIEAADKTIFKATGIGSMKISIPNGNGMADVTLNNVLYSPDPAFTLISLSRCDRSGYSAILKDWKCTISDPKGRLVGVIPMSSDGLYKIEHSTQVTASTARKLTIDEVHRWLSHIEPQAAQKSIVKGHIMGIDLDLDMRPMQCIACTKGKMTRVKIPNE
jgi:hypothetical protein